MDSFRIELWKHNQQIKSWVPCRFQCYLRYSINISKITNFRKTTPKTKYCLVLWNFRYTYRKSGSLPIRSQYALNFGSSLGKSLKFQNIENKWCWSQNFNLNHGFKDEWIKNQTRFETRGLTGWHVRPYRMIMYIKPLSIPRGLLQDDMSYTECLISRSWLVRGL